MEQAANLNKKLRKEHIAELRMLVEWFKFFVESINLKNADSAWSSLNDFFKDLQKILPTNQ